jgi:hypothetical protein
LARFGLEPSNPVESVRGQHQYNEMALLDANGGGRSGRLVLQLHRRSARTLQLNRHRARAAR